MATAVRLAAAKIMDATSPPEVWSPCRARPGWWLAQSECCCRNSDWLHALTLAAWASRDALVQAACTSDARHAAGGWCSLTHWLDSAAKPFRAKLEPLSSSDARSVAAGVGPACLVARQLSTVCALAYDDRWDLCIDSIPFGNQVALAWT